MEVALISCQRFSSQRAPLRRKLSVVGKYMQHIVVGSMGMSKTAGTGLGARFSDEACAPTSLFGAAGCHTFGKVCPTSCLWGTVVVNEQDSWTRVGPKVLLEASARRASLTLLGVSPIL